MKILSPYIFSHIFDFALSIIFFKARFVDKGFNIFLKTLLFNFLDEVLLIIACNIWSTRKNINLFILQLGDIYLSRCNVASLGRNEFAISITF